MNRKHLLAALLALIFAAPALAADDGWHPGNITCSGAKDTAPAIVPGTVASWCPISSTSIVVVVKSFADFNWNADTTSTTAGIVAGQKTLTVTKCSGSTTTTASACKNILTDSNSNTTITSGDPTGSFTLSSGTWLIATTDAANAANGLLHGTGR